MSTMMQHTMEVDAGGERGVGHGDRRGSLLTLVVEDNLGTRMCVFPHPKCAKYLYAALFLVANVVAVNTRDVELSAFTEVQRFHGCDHDRYCLGAEGALRVSLACLLFFVVMFASTVWTKKVHECRHFWNSHFGLAVCKIPLVAGCLFIATLTPSPWMEFYGKIARVGAWLFLVIELISVTRFIMWLNKWYEKNRERWRFLVSVIAFLLHAGSFVAVFKMLSMSSSNIVNITIVSVTLILMVLMICISCKYEVTAGYLAPGLMTMYIAFTCWTVIKRSEAHREFKKGENQKGAEWLTILSFIFVVVVMAYSTLSAGEDYEWLQFNDDEESEDDIPYGYGYFHLVFAMASMYFGMLLVGWNAYHTMERWTIDVGWWSAVVRSVNGLLAAMLYIWMLRTRFIWTKRKLIITRSGASLVPRAKFV